MLEMIIALGIIVSGIAGTLSLVSSSLNASNESQTRVVATGLAREAMEASRVIRDGNWLAAVPWNTALVGPGGDRTGVPFFMPEKDWRIDFTAAGISDADAVVYEDPDGSLRQYDGAPPAGAVESPFRRLLTLRPICMVEGDAATIASVDGTACPGGQVEVGTDVRVLVTWTVSGRGHRLEMQGELYDWR
ncbi:hypothetical protein EPO33_00225 [Patescibacteria group bacterium]|nr:MAG: hypothetical protein EPO33_00225 [Patescibacteria group bacterium]